MSPSHADTHELYQCQMTIFKISMSSSRVVPHTKKIETVREGAHIQCNTLQHTAPHCCSTLLQHTQCHHPMRHHTQAKVKQCEKVLIRTATHCNTLQHTINTKTLQHTATPCNTLQHTATHCDTRQHTATHGNTLQQIALHRTTLHHTQAKLKQCERVLKLAAFEAAIRAEQTSSPIQSLQVGTLSVGVYVCTRVIFIHIYMYVYIQSLQVCV